MSDNYNYEMKPVPVFIVKRDESGFLSIKHGYASDHPSQLFVADTSAECSAFVAGYYEAEKQ